MRNLDLCSGPVESCDENGRRRINVDFKRSYGEDLRVWYSVPQEQWQYISRDLMDPFVIAALLKAMEGPGDPAGTRTGFLFPAG